MKKITRPQYIFVSISFIGLAILLFVWFLLHGQTSVSGDYPEPEVSRSFDCSLDNFKYPIYGGQDVTKSNTSIVVIFVGDQLNAISLTQKYYYNGESDAMADKSRFRIAMSKSFANTSLKYGALGVNYAVDDNMLRMSISADHNEINDKSKDYFLVYGNLPKTFSEYKKIYEDQQFICKENNNG